MKKNIGKVSVGMVARAAGVSAASASVALNNQAGVSAATRERILRIAKKLGYAPDAQIGGWMARVRDAKSKDLLPIAWLNTAWEEDAYRRYLFHSPYLIGAKERALELGYKLDEIWCHEPGLTMKRLTKVLYQRGIEGVIITHPARHLRLDWVHLASVALGTSILAPGLHRITGDFCFNFQLALKSLRRLGFRRVGICLGCELDSYSNYTIRAITSAFNSQCSREERIPPLFHAHFLHAKGIAEVETKKRAAEVSIWLKRHKPDVIVCHDNRLEQWVKDAGYRVPDDIGIVHLAVDDDVLDWAGIHSGRRKTGATAVNQLVALMHNHQYGIPETPLTILIRGTWQTGRTLGSPGCA
jgi:LacI family transcriptional regulator, galactose operon repressor